MKEHKGEARLYGKNRKDLGQE